MHIHAVEFGVEAQGGPWALQLAENRVLGNDACRLAYILRDRHIVASFFAEVRMEAYVCMLLALRRAGPGGSASERVVEFDAMSSTNTTKFIQAYVGSASEFIAKTSNDFWSNVTRTYKINNRYNRAWAESTPTARESAPRGTRAF